MDTISNIRREIFKSTKDRIFSTRDFLAYGMRGAVDQALYRLVKRGLLVRVARGVFIKEGSQTPTAEQVAQCKAQAFGKKIRKHCADIAAELKMIVQGNSEPTFATTGRTTSFSFSNKRIHLKAIGPRKMKLSDSTVGRALRAFWHLGKNICLPELIAATMRYFNRQDRQEIKVAAAFMPAWLTDQFAYNW